jgi:GT2 family glycosyltransferase
MASRLRDATRSPQRLWWFGVRVVKLALRGELPAMLSRLNAASPDAAAYRSWLAAHDEPIVATPAAAPWREVRVDLADEAVRARVAARLAESLPAAQPNADAVLLVGADVVPEACLAGRLAAGLAACPEAVAAFADHDHLDAQGRRERPVLASAWDAEQAFERNPCGPLLLLRDGHALAASARATAGEAISAAVAELAATPAVRVLHVPGVLCHVIDGLQDVSADWRSRHARRGVEAARRRGAAAEFDPAATPVVSFRVPPGTTLAVIIPVRDHAELLRSCVASLPVALDDRAVEVVVVDNGSTDPEVAALCVELGRSRPLRVVAQPAPFNFAALCNAGAAQATGDVLLFLNNDARFASHEGVAELVALAARPWAGAAGPWLDYEDGRVQSAGVLVGVNRTATSALAGFAPDDPAAVAWAQSRRRVSAVMGACLAVERRKFTAVGGFDERFAVSHNEVDLCLRLERAGFANVVTPHSRVLHVEGASRGFEVEPAERARLAEEEQLFRERWKERIAATDPAHHPWLAREGNPFAFASGRIDAPPRLGWSLGNE